MVTFKKYAGSLQLEIRDFEDLLEALKVPKTQWVATACPIVGLNCDARFLHFVDADGNGRIRVEELSNAVTWSQKMLSDQEGIDKSSDELLLSRLSKDAAKLKDAADLVLEAQGAKDHKSITLKQVRDSEKPLREAYFNGDGVIAPESIKDTRLADVVTLVLACVPETKNHSGKAGVTKEHLDDVKKRIAKAKEHNAKKVGAFVWADASESRSDTVRAVRARVDEYFLQCRLVASNPGAAEQLRVGGDTIAASLGDTAVLTRALSAAPIALPVAEGALEWSKLYRGPQFELLGELRSSVCDAIFGTHPKMTESQWKELVAKADALEAWRTGVAADKVLFEKLADLEKVTDEEFAAVRALCDADLARKEKLDAIEQLEKLVLFQRWLLRFANNFISMPDMYDPGFTALFEQGKLILAGRLFTFSVRVADRAAHAALASRGTMFIAYVKVTAKDGGETFEVAVPVTSGTAAGVEVGKRGVFVDAAGKEWDAAVVQVVSNPVSLIEAVLAPYKRIGAFVSGKIESWAGEGDRALEQQLNKGAEEAQHARERAAVAAASGADGAGPQAAPPATPAAAPAETSTAGGGGGVGGNVAIALSIAISAVSAVIGTIVGIFAGKSILQIIGLLIGLFMAVSVPAGVFAWLKLRQRDMAIVLEACGWALNDRMRLGKFLGPLFTRRPSRPKDARVETLDSVQETIERRRAEGLDEIERTGLRPLHWLLIVVALLLLVSYQWRFHLCTFASHKGWIGMRTCEAIRPVPPAPPAATTPAAVAPGAH